MFIAHLPAGYVIARGFHRCGTMVRGGMAACLLGSLFPDIDLLWFYLVDGCRYHHHSYVTHWPVVWLLLLTAAGIGWMCHRRNMAVPVFFFAFSGLVHVLLDGVVGDIQLFAPWSDTYYALATVPARVQPWWLNFFLHWSMLVELLICAAAVWLLLSRRSRGKHTNQSVR